MDKERYLNNVINFTRLISLYLNKKEDPDLTISDEEVLFYAKLAKRHSLKAILFKVLKDTKVNVNKQYLAKLEEHYLLSLRKALSFEKEREELNKYLNNNQIHFLPLKGIIMKDYYLDPYSREFADNDILFEKSKDKLVKEFFTKRGYKVEMFRKSNHDIYQKEPFYNFEMHRALFYEREDLKRFVKYFDGYLEKSPIKENYEHVLTNEDFYIYFTAHTHKHFSISGCGIRTLIDYYLFLKNNHLDFDYINKELSRLDLLGFSNMISSLSKKIFDNQNLNEEEKETLLFIASSGTYGILEHSVSKGVKEKGRFRYFMSRIFPPMEYYKMTHPWAYKCRILIPFAWIARLFRIIFTKPKKAVKELKLISKTKKNKE